MSAYSQIFDMLNTELYKGRVKLVSEFIDRFNGDEKNPYIDPKTLEIDKINLCQLFDADFIIENRKEVEPKAFQFVDSILLNNVKIHYEDSNWYARINCVGTFKGKEITFGMYLVVEPRGNDMYKWVIADVEGDIFELKPSSKSDKIMLLPNEHETDFMRLNSITSEIDDYITLYSSQVNSVNRLSVFNTLVYYGYLNIEYVKDLEYTFLQVPGYAFTIKEFIRDSDNSGWLIHSWEQMNDECKIEFLQKLYSDKYNQISSESNVIPEQAEESSKSVDKACEMVQTFVNLLNNYTSSKNKETLDSIENTVKGRYTFIISDEIVNELAKFNKAKNRKSYKLDTLTGWLSRTPSPIKSIYAENIQLFENEFLLPKYSEGYTLISCDLITEGDIQIKEQVLFFIYENQIAGVKLISDCF